MSMADWIFIAIAVVVMVLGALLGFGKLLKIFTGGIIGVLISVVVTYFLLGIVASWGFVQDLLAKLLGLIESGNNGFTDFLIKIGIEKIILAVIIFIVVQVLRIIIVRIIKSIVEIDNIVLKIINRVGGAIFFLGVAAMITLLVFHIISWVGGDTAVNVRNWLDGALRLQWVYDNNPLMYIVYKIIPQ